METTPHIHRYDAQGRQLCCTLEEKIEAETATVLTDEHDDEEGHDPDHTNESLSAWRAYLPAILSLVLLLAGIALDEYVQSAFFTGWVRIAWYVAAYLPVGTPVIREMFGTISNGEIFSEFTLMVIATLGAFAIGEYPEGVAVMLFYTVGELFQIAAVRRAKGNIKALLDQRPDEVTVLENGAPRSVKAETVGIGSILQLKPGEKLALDGILLSETASFNTAALTGESKPDTMVKGATILAGMINLTTVAQVKVTTAYTDSKLSRILEMVQKATAQKAPTELFIRKFAKIYTPVVVLLAVLIVLMPYLFVKTYNFHDWLYRALIFLVISCPCALVISIPLGYFGGIGAASRHGILFKGSNFLDIMAEVKNVVMDKTGTMTEGVFLVQEIKINPGFDKKNTLAWINALENNSTHPVATAIHQFVGAVDNSFKFNETEEIPGHGMRAVLNGKSVFVGNFKLMEKFGIAFPSELANNPYTNIAIAENGQFIGHLSIADQIKEDALTAVQKLKKLGVQVTMLSGDKTAVVQLVAQKLGIKNAFGDLLPEDKVNKVKALKARGESVAFVGDGVNDAPVVALSDAGIAMGGLGSDATIETADIVIQDDRPSKIPMSIEIGQATKRIVWQNIGLAFGVKVIVLALGAGGLATMWEAVFADVGVALLAILNAVRIQRMNF